MKTHESGRKSPRRPGAAAGLLFAAIVLVSIAGVAGADSSWQPTGGRRWDGKTITVYEMSGLTILDAMKKWAPEFTQKTGAKVQFVDFPYEVLLEKAVNDQRTGAGQYDVLDLPAEFIAALYPYMATLDDYIKKSKFDVEDIFPAVWEKTGSFQGKRYGIPSYVEGWVIAIRTDLFQAAGLRPPTTYDQLLAAAKKLANPAKGIYGWTEPGINVQMVKNFYTLYWSEGSSPRMLLNKDWTSSLNNAAGKAALKKQKALGDLAPPGYLGWDNPQSDAIFLAGKAAMDEAWSSILLGLLDDPTKSQVVGKWRLIAPPGRAVFRSNGAMYVSKIPPKDIQDLSWEWVRFALNKEHMLDAFLNFGNPSGRISQWSAPEVKARYGDRVQGIADSMAKVRLQGTLDTAQWGEYLTRQGNAQSQYMAGQLDADKTLVEMDKQITDLYSGAARPAFDYYEK